MKTVRKWTNREFLSDVSSRLYNIKYSLTEIEQGIFASIRKVEWMSLDYLFETIQINFPHAKYSAVYNALKIYGVNKVPN